MKAMSLEWEVGVMGVVLFGIQGCGRVKFTRASVRLRRWLSLTPPPMRRI